MLGTGESIHRDVYVPSVLGILGVLWKGRFLGRLQQWAPCVRPYGAAKPRFVVVADVAVDIEVRAAGGRASAAHLDV